MRRALAALSAVVAAAAPAAPPAAAAPAVHAHRGGSVIDGVPTFPENTLPAFRHAWLREGAVLELDVKLTRDGVPVVFHDATLDRVTACSGPVVARALSELAACPTDVLGSPGSPFGSVPTTEPVPIPTLAEVLGWARVHDAPVNVEIKNIPTDRDDFDPTDAFANRVVDALEAAALPPERTIVQSFWPPDLDVVERRLPAVATSLLTLAAMNDGGPGYAAGRNYEWVSPGWPVSTDYVTRAHALGRKVVPYTLDSRADVEAAAAAGVDALISNDPAMARRALGIPPPPPPSQQPPPGSGTPQPAPDREREDTEPPEVAFEVALFASDTASRPRTRVRWTGRDSGSGVVAYTLQVRRRRPGRAPAWRSKVIERRVTSFAFRGRPGTAYEFRVRARDRAGNLSRWVRGRHVVPLDQADGRIRYRGEWRVVRRRGAWLGSVSVPARGDTASIHVRGRELWLIGSRLARGGRLRVEIGRRARVLSFRGGRRVQPRARVLAGRLPRGRRTVVRLRALGGRVELDGLAVRR